MTLYSVASKSCDACKQVKMEKVDRLIRVAATSSCPADRNTPDAQNDGDE